MSSALALIKPSRTLRDHIGAVNSVRYNQSGHYCISAGSDRIVRLWNPYKGLLMQKYTGHGYEVADVAVSSDNAKLTSCGGDKLVYLWDVTTAQVIRKFGGSRASGHTARINCVDFGAPDDVILASGSYDTSTKLWDVRARSQDAIQTLDTARDSISSVSVQGCEIFTSSIDGCVRSHDMRSGRVAVDSTGAPVGSAKLSSDQKCILAAGLDSALRLFDKESGEVLAEYTGHENSAYQLDCCLSFDDSAVLCGSEDGRLYVWDLIEGDRGALVAPKGHQSAVCGLSAHLSRLDFLTGSHDGSIILWQAPAS